MAVDNKKNYPNNAYYFPQAVDVLKAMKVALKEFGGSDEVEKDTVKKEDKKEETVSDKKAKKDPDKKKNTELLKLFVRFWKLDFYCLKKGYTFFL